MSDFSFKYRVPYADTDQMGVVYYANFLVFFERARNEFFREIEYPYSKLEEEGFMLPVVEAHVDYKNPAKYDDLLSITVNSTNIKGCRVRVENEILNESGDLICKGYTIHCFICSDSRKPVRVPESLLKQLEHFGEMP